MAGKKPALPIINTPLGVLAHVYLNKPDDYKNQDKYKTDITCDAAASKGLMAKIDEAIDAEMIKAKKARDEKVAKLRAEGENAKAKKIGEPVRKDSYEILLDSDDEPTGKVRFRPNVKAKGENKKTGDTWSNKPAIFDAAGKPTDVAVYGGSEGKCAVQLVPYVMEADGEIKVGVTLRLKAVKLIKLAQKGAKDAAGYGFGDEEEGYRSDDVTSFREDDEDDDDSDSSSKGDDSDDDDDF